jgi:cobalt-zinc-cadmium efflux system membrane fusion protein
MSRRTILLLSILLAGGPMGCGDRAPVPEGEEHGHDDHDEHGHDAAGEVHLTSEQRERAGITVATAGPGELDAGVELPGEVRADGNRVAHIVPRFPGIVKDVRKDIGDRVRSGEVLAVVESSESLAPYSLITLIDGTIVEKHLTRGEAVDRDKQVFVVADLSSVWVDASVFQQDLARVRVGQRVRVLAAAGGPQADGELSYITPIVDAPTRTATARAVLPNDDGRWRPGMFVTVRALDPVQVPVLVPRDALQTVEGESVVFVHTEHGFAVRPVLRGREGATQVEVVRGLDAGERYAVTETFLLKAELGKGAAEHEH